MPVYKFVEIPTYREPTDSVETFAPRIHVLYVEWLCDEIRRSGVHVINMDDVRSEAWETNNNPEHEQFVEAKKIVDGMSEKHANVVLVGCRTDLITLGIEPALQICVMATGDEIYDQYCKCGVKQVPIPDLLMCFITWKNPVRLLTKLSTDRISVKICTIDETIRYNFK